MAVTWFCRLLLVLQVLGCGICGEQVAMPLVKDLTRNGFDDFINSSTVRTVYFYKKDLPRLGDFLQQYEKSAQAVKVHNLQFGKVDCNKEHVKQYCQMKESEKFVFTFKNHEELLKLSLDSMFDVDSILSNILQIVLLREMPIAQTRDEYVYFERISCGKKDIILSFHKTIGTYAHRILMEVTFAYNTNYQFLLTTTPAVVEHLPFYNENEYAAIWLMRCKDTEYNEEKLNSCEAVKYQETMNLVSLVRFLRVLDLPPRSFVPKERDLNFYYMNGMNTVICVYDYDVYDDAMQIVTDIIQRYRGVIGVVVVHIDELENIKDGFKLADKFVPVIGLRLRDATSFEMALPGSDMEEFIGSRLEKLVSKETVIRDQSSMDSEVSDEDKDDDEISQLVHKLRPEDIDKQHVKFLTDESYDAALKEAKLLIVLFYLVSSSFLLAMWTLLPDSF